MEEEVPKCPECDKELVKRMGFAQNYRACPDGGGKYKDGQWLKEPHGLPASGSVKRALLMLWVVVVAVSVYFFSCQPIRLTVYEKRWPPRSRASGGYVSVIPNSVRKEKASDWNVIIPLILLVGMGITTAVVWPKREANRENSQKMG